MDPGYGHVHIAFGDPANETRVYVTYLDVPVGVGTVRLDAPDPGNCSF